ncbi:hypothetical protein SACT1_0234 [Streptomyces sp. ACT-1]|nr:hypothetical protein SACT1_0234 [Streptomyces sp. ACT-1]
MTLAPGRLPAPVRSADGARARPPEAGNGARAWRGRRRSVPVAGGMPPGFPFFELHAPARGHDPQALTAEHMHQFVADQRQRERDGLVSLAARGVHGKPSIVTANTRQRVFHRTRRLLRGALESGAGARSDCRAPGSSRCPPRPRRTPRRSSGTSPVQASRSPPHGSTGSRSRRGGGCSPANPRRPARPAGARSRPSSPSLRSTTRRCRKCWPNWRRGRTKWTPTPSTANCPSHARRSPGGSARAGSPATRRSASSGAGTTGPHQVPGREPDRRPVAPGRRPTGEDVLEDALRVRGPRRRGAVPECGGPLPAGQAREDHRQGRGDRVDPLAVRHRPAAAPPHRPPYARPAVPHRPQGPGRDTDARRARRPAGRGSPTAGPKRSSRRTPACWPTRSPRPRTSRNWTAGRSTGSATVPSHTTGTSTPMLLARSRHAVARHVAERDPAARRRARPRRTSPDVTPMLAASGGVLTRPLPSFAWTQRIQGRRRSSLTFSNRATRR